MEEAMLVKVLQPIKLKKSNEKKFIKTGSIMDLPEEIIKILLDRGKVVKLHPEIERDCMQPFPCELIEDGGVCSFIKTKMKRHCLGPYRVTKKGIFSYKCNR
ncbi:MAG: hypothetical protein QXN68_02830 [Thermoplasmata archaeon]